MEKHESVELFYKEGSSNKIYRVLLERKDNGWIVLFAYGRVGSTLTGGFKTNSPVSYEEASKIYGKLIQSKISKGYSQSDKISSNIAFLSGIGKDTGFRPQLLNECPEEDIEKYLKSDEWCAQMKLDGRNRLLIKKGRECTGSNRKGLEVAISDEIKKEMSKLPDCVLAGEDLGDKVMVFDIISRKSLHFWERDREVKELLKEFKYILSVYTAWTEKEKRVLLQKLRDNNEEGIVFKHKDALYTAGRPASGGSALKYKFVSSASVIVTKLSKSKRSIQVSVYDNDILTIIGNVTVYPNQNVPKKGEIVEVKYLYFFREGSLFQPVLIGKGDCSRDDIDKSACTINQLKYKKGE